MNGSVKDASFWRSRAEKTRAKAENYYLESEKERLLKIAYERWQFAPSSCRQPRNGKLGF